MQTLFNEEPEAPTIPDLASYDVIVVNSSAGKDSQCMLDYVVELATAAGVRDRIVVLHCDLGLSPKGEPIEWPGTKELAQEHAEHYGLRFVVVQRGVRGFLEQVDYRGKWMANKQRFCTDRFKTQPGQKAITALADEVRNSPGFLEQVERLGHWPRAATRNCTSTFKREQGEKAVNELTRELNATGFLEQVKHRGKWSSQEQRLCTSNNKREPANQGITHLANEARGKEKRVPRILQCFGFRAQESPRRKKLPRFSEDKRISNSRKTVHVWLPIHDWLVEQVWERIKQAGTRHHYAYDKGMTRLSCRFCLAGETEVATRSGLQAISSLAGGTHALLVPRVTKYGLSSHGAFVPVEVRSFGLQPLLEVKLSRERQQKTVFATAEHRWLVWAGEPYRDATRKRRKYSTETKTTSDLLPGDRLRELVAMPTDGCRMVPFAVAQGFVYGDGAKGMGERPATLTIYDEEKDAAVMPFFAAHDFMRTKKGLNVYGLPRLWKMPPSFQESRSFLLSWLAGYFAADGCVSELGQAVLSSASRASISLARSVAAVCGVRHGTSRSVSRIGTGTRPTPLYSLSLDPRTVPEWFFLIGSHRARIAARASVRSAKERLWKVASVKDSGRAEEVFCAVVPKAHAFGLADGLMTGNCIFAPKSQLILSGRLNPALLDEYVEVEKKIGHKFRVELSLADVKQAIEAGEQGGEADDGCWNM